jgi:sterol desaturase/sphingolipid hydroxylase (fatty acid hydroxylase superfamily)
MFSFNAGWVHPVEIAVAAICELAYPLLFNVHPLTVWIFLYSWVFWLVEEHSGDDVWWSLWHIAPLIGGGAPPHSLHHAPHLTKNFGFVFSCWDRLFGTFQAPHEDRIKLN